MSRARLRRLVAGGALLTSLAGCGGSSQATSPVTVTVPASASSGGAVPASASSGGAVASAASSGGAVSSVSPTPGGATSASAVPAPVSSRAAATAEEPAARDVQGLLQQLNYRVALTGSYDQTTRAVVRRFQREHRMPVTGVVDEATRLALSQAVATFSPSSTVDGDGYTFDGTWWSADDLFRSRNRQCVVYEQRWQAAVEANSRSRSEAAEADAQALGCDPDQWTPRNIPHPRVNEVHLNGEPCTASQGGTIATGSRPVAICNQYRVGVWRWHVTSS